MKSSAILFGLLLSYGISASPLMDRKTLVEIDKLSMDMNVKTLNASMKILAKKKVRKVNLIAEEFIRQGVIDNTLPVQLGKQFLSEEQELKLEPILKSGGFKKLPIYNNDRKYLGYLYYRPFGLSNLVHTDASFITFEIPFQDKEITEDGRYSIRAHQYWYREGVVGQQDGFQHHNKEKLASGTEYGQLTD